MGSVGAYGVSESNATDSSDQIRWKDANGYKYIRDAIGILEKSVQIFGWMIEQEESFLVRRDDEIEVAQRSV